MRLTAHPSTPVPDGWILEVRCELDPTEVRLVWLLRTDPEAIRLPPPAAPARRDGLWRHTCFEWFLADASGEGYREFNFSPSSQWAAYAFTRYREGMTALDLPDPPRIALAVERGALQLTARVPRAALATGGGARATPRRCGLAAVLERSDGRSAYVALAHPPGRPDFHHRAGFTAEVCL